MNVTIVGGGLTGLTAAYYLGHAKPDWNITLYEQAPRFGGKIQTQRVDDFVVELGPDSYLGRKTEMTDLIYDLGLGDTLVSNETGQAFVYDKGSIHPIPGGSIMGDSNGNDAFCESDAHFMAWETACWLRLL